MEERRLLKTTRLKYERIIDEWFLNGFDGTKAYKKFFPKVKKGNTATTNFSKIQALPEMQGYIKKKHEEAARHIQTTHEGLLAELKAWIESDITETIGLTSEELKLLPVGLRRLITKYKVTNKDFYNSEGSIVSSVETVEVHFVSKERAIEMINKHVGFYEIDNRQKASEIIVTASNEKHKALIEDIIAGKL